MIYNNLSRRHFLQGFGASLALPLLPSLFVSRKALAGALSAPSTRFLAMMSDHGATPLDRWYPSLSPYTPRSDVNDQRNYNAIMMDMIFNNVPAALRKQIPGTSHVVSIDDMINYMSGFTDRHVIRGSVWGNSLKKISLLRGVDIPHYVGHNGSAVLGNYASSDQGDRASDNAGYNSGYLQFNKTIDLRIAESFSSIDERTTINLSHNAGMSISHPGMPGPGGSTFRDAIGNPTRLTAETPAALWQALFGDTNGCSANSTTPPPAASTKITNKRVVDAVLEDLNSLLQSNRRLSSEDRRRVEEHVQYVADVQLAVIESERDAGGSGGFSQGGTGLSAADLNAAKTDQSGINSIRPGMNLNDSRARTFQLQAKIIAAAFRCGKRRVATLRLGEVGAVSNDIWHKEYVHPENGSGALPNSPDGIVAQNRFIAENIFLELVKDLSAVEDPNTGRTYLDNSVLYWRHECTDRGHSTYGLPVMMAGGGGEMSGGGNRLATGKYIDYRDHDKKDPNYYGKFNANPGVHQNQLLSSILRVFGMSGASANLQYVDRAGAYVNSQMQSNYWKSRGYYSSMSHTDALPFFFKG